MLRWIDASSRLESRIGVNFKAVRATWSRWFTQMVLDLAEGNNGALDDGLVSNLREDSVACCSWQSSRDDEELGKSLSYVDQEGAVLDSAAYASLLRRCRELNSLSMGRRVHAHIVKHGGTEGTFLGNVLVEMYGKCSSLDEAFAVFKEIRYRNVFSWTIMVSAYAQNGYHREAIQIFREMLMEGGKPDGFTFSAALQGCSGLSEVTEIHSLIVESGCESDVVVANSLVSMYVRMGHAEDAGRVFERMPRRTVVSWSAIIAAYAHEGDVLELFRRMLLEGIKLDRVSFLSTLESVHTRGDEALVQAKSMQAFAIQSGFDTDITVGNALVSVFGKCGSLDDAASTFNKMPRRNVVSWNALIGAYAQHGHSGKAFGLFQKMDLEGLGPNKVTFVSIVDACRTPELLPQGKVLHARITQLGHDSSDSILQTALINMYGKCGSVEDARDVFDKMCSRDVISWSAIITAYAQCGHGSREALELFQKMELEGVKPDTVTFISILDACTSLSQGLEIHKRICCGSASVLVGNTLISMYTKFGSLEHAKDVWDKMPTKDVVSWNAMVAAYTQNGQGKLAVDYFREMSLEGVKPNEITFTSILSACSHAGMVCEAFAYFAVIQEHGILPSAEHYGSMLDLIGRVGWLSRIDEILDKMPFQPDAKLWTSLLGACRLHGEVQLAAQAADKVANLDAGIPSQYVLLSNVYAEAA